MAVDDLQIINMRHMVLRRGFLPVIQIREVLLKILSIYVSIDCFTIPFQTNGTVHTRDVQP